MTESAPPSKLPRVLGWTLVVVGLAMFAVRLQHDGAYAFPRGAGLVGGAGSLVVGAVLAFFSSMRALRWTAMAAAPVVLFLALYSTMAELEEVVSFYATDSGGRPQELRLWIVDRDGQEWVGMPASKAAEHSLDGVPIDMLRNGTTRCVVPVLHEDRETVQAVHALKLEKYAVARASAAIGLYPDEAPETAVSLRLDPCPVGEKH